MLFFPNLVPSVSAGFYFHFHRRRWLLCVQCVVFIFYKTTETLGDMNNKNTISVFIKHGAKERKEYLHVYLSTPEPRISFISISGRPLPLPPWCPCLSVQLQQECARIGFTLRTLVPPARQYPYVNIWMTNDLNEKSAGDGHGEFEMKPATSRSM